MNERAVPQTMNDIARILFTTRNGPGWDLLCWIADARYVTTDLVALRFYPTEQGVRSATYRLAQLRHWKVDDQPLLETRPLRNGRQIHFLSASGARLVSDYLQRPIKTFWHEAVPRVADGIVQHYLAVTQFEIALLWHAAIHGAEVLSWNREPVIETEAGALRPDAAFSYAYGGRSWHYAVEIDRGTEAPAKFAAKIPKYAGLHRAAYGLLWPEVPDCLVVVQAGGQARAQRLMAEVSALPRGADDFRRFKYVAAEDLYDIPLSQRGRLPVVGTAFDQPVCFATKGGESIRRSVFN